MDEYESKTIDVPLNIWELRHLRYHAYTRINDTAYTPEHRKFMKNIFEKLDVAHDELSDTIEAKEMEIELIEPEGSSFKTLIIEGTDLMTGESVCEKIKIYDKK